MPEGLLINTLSRLGPSPAPGLVLADARLFVVLTQAEARELVARGAGEHPDARRGLSKIRTALYNVFLRSES